MNHNTNGLSGKENAKESLDNYKYSPLKVTLIYTFFGGSWILLSDTILHSLFSNLITLNKISILKGLLYVIVTAMLVFILTSSLVKKLNRQGKKLIDSYDELAGTYNKLEKSQNELNIQYKILLEYKEKLYKLAYQDHLTMLPNRRLFNNNLHKIKKDFKNNKALTLLILDVDNFKYVNDIHGHEYGDKIIVSIAKRIEDLLLDRMQLYRIGGDEFAILIFRKIDNVEVEAFAQLIINDIKHNMYVSTKAYLSLSIGIASFPDSSNNFDDIVKFADVALYKAKDAGKSTYSIFETSLKQMIDEKVLVVDKLKLALKKDEFKLHFQPQVDLNTGEIRGFEALARWYNEDLGFVPPNKFIPIAEETKIIIDIGKWILMKSIEFGAKLNRNSDKKYIISVNISVVQWMQEDFVESLEEIMKNHDLSEEYLELEITESILIHSFDQTIAKLLRLKEKGIKVALDDFGTGFSSLNYLKELPISTLKIDKTFIDDILDKKSKNVHILNAIIALGHNIGLEVIAEGVETEDQMNYLYDNDCDSIQGYFYSKPLEQTSIQHFISTFNDGFDKMTKCISKQVVMS